MSIHKSLLFLSGLLFTTGVALMTPIGISIIQQQNALATAQASPNTVQIAPKHSAGISGVPRNISLGSLSIDVSVNDGTYDSHTGEWTITENSAFYATPTDPINPDEGSTLIYGHNSQKIFGKLLSIQKNAEATVQTDNGYEFTYTYTGTNALNPADTSVLRYSGKPRLVLQTCSGLWNQTRQVFYFDLKSYQKL